MVPVNFSNIHFLFLWNQVIFVVIQFCCGMGSLFSKADPLDQTSVYQISQPDPLCSFGIVSSTYESPEREEIRVTSKEEYEVDWAWVWVEGGGASIGRGGTGVVESGISALLGIA